MVILLQAALAAEEPVLLDVLGEWADRSVSELDLGGVKAHRSVLAAYDHDVWRVEAAMGAVISDQGRRSRPGRVEVVVGDDELDSSRFTGGGRQRGDSVLGRPSFVVEDVPIAVSRDLWLATDSTFKAAVKQWQVKQAALSQLGATSPPDWSAADPQTRIEPGERAPIDAETLRTIAVQASARLRGLKGLRNGRVSAKAVDGDYLLATSEGTRLVQPEGHAVVYAWADVLREDGVQTYEYEQWVARTVDELPSVEVIGDAVEAMGKRVLARSKAEQVPYYEGPVVFEGDAAVDFFRYLVAPELRGTPPSPDSRRTYEQLTRSGPRVGRRVLPRDWSVVDDPASSSLGFAYDREGVPAKSLSLVSDGYVSDLLMTRVPRHDITASNGHARGTVQGTWSARLSAWTVTPASRLSDKKFDKTVGKLVKDSKLDRWLVVRSMNRGKAGGLPRPSDAVWRYADGREEPVLALAFEKADRRTARAIAAAAGQQTSAYLAPTMWRGTAQGESGLPTVATVPQRILVPELEAVFPGATSQPHVLAPPSL